MKRMFTQLLVVLVSISSFGKLLRPDEQENTSEIQLKPDATITGLVTQSFLLL